MIQIILTIPRHNTQRMTKNGFDGSFTHLLKMIKKAVSDFFLRLILRIVAAYIRWLFEKEVKKRSDK